MVHTGREITTSWDVTCFAHGGESQLLQPHYSCFVFSRSLTCMANLFWLCLCKYKPLLVQQHLSMTFFSEMHINLIELNRNFYICMHYRIFGLTEWTCESLLYIWCWWPYKSTCWNCLNKGNASKLQKGAVLLYLQVHLTWTCVSVPSTGTYCVVCVLCNFVILCSVHTVYSVTL